MTFASQIQAFAKKCDSLTTKVYQGSCHQISEDIIEESPVSTGSLIGTWTPGIGSAESDFFKGGESAWVKGVKDEGIASANRGPAMAYAGSKLATKIPMLSKKDEYHFTNNVPYIEQAEHTGWDNTDAYHMREKALVNWQLIVDTVANRLNK